MTTYLPGYYSFPLPLKECPPQSFPWIGQWRQWKRLGVPWSSACLPHYLLVLHGGFYVVDHNSYHNQARVLHNHNLLDCTIKKERRTYNYKLNIMTVTLFLMIFPWKVCMYQLKKGNSILFLNNLSSVICFCIFGALWLIYVQNNEIQTQIQFSCMNWVVAQNHFHCCPKRILCRCSCASSPFPRSFPP